MFHLTCLVDDKKLVAVMHRLSGVVANLQVVPATNVEVKGGKPRSTVPGGKMAFLALEVWRKSGKPEVSSTHGLAAGPSARSSAPSKRWR